MFDNGKHDHTVISGPISTIGLHTNLMKCESLLLNLTKRPNISSGNLQEGKPQSKDFDEAIHKVFHF